MMFFTYPDTGRKLRQTITGLLKSGLTSEVKRLNYIKSYTLKEGKLHKQEEKLLRIASTPDQEASITKFLAKACPEAKLRKE